MPKAIIEVVCTPSNLRKKIYHFLSTNLPALRYQWYGIAEICSFAKSGIYYDNSENIITTGNGKLDAFEQFLSHIENRAFRMAYIATGQEQEALDIVQDSMLQLAQKYAHKPETEWPPLFHRILQSKIRDWYRRQRVRNQWRVFFTDDDDNENPIEQAIDHAAISSEDQLDQQRAIASLEQALHRLPLRQQQAFLLRAWEGLDVAETAKAMGCSQGSVKTHYSRAIRALQTLLEAFNEAI